MTLTKPHISIDWLALPNITADLPGRVPGKQGETRASYKSANAIKYNCVKTELLQAEGSRGVCTWRQGWGLGWPLGSHSRSRCVTMCRSWYLTSADLHQQIRVGGFVSTAPEGHLA